MQLKVPKQLLNYAPAALIRVGYLYPEMIFSFETDEVIVEKCPADRESSVRRDVFYTIYREKIYTETLAMRQALFEATLRQ